MEQASLPYQTVRSPRLKGAQPALILLLLINLFNYINSQVLAAVESDIQKQFFPTNPRNAGLDGHAGDGVHGDLHDHRAHLWMARRSNQPMGHHRATFYFGVWRRADPAWRRCSADSVC